MQDSSDNFEIIRGSPKMWWAAAVNHGVRYVLNNEPVTSKTPILVQNDDVTFGPDYLSYLISDWDYRENFIIGSICVGNNTNLILRASMIYDRAKAKLVFKYKNKNTDFLSSSLSLPSDVLTGRGTLIPARVFSEIGFYNEKFLPHYRADNELIYRAKKKGFIVLVSTRAVVYSSLDSHYKLRNNIKSKLNYLFNRKSVVNLKDLFFILIYVLA